MSSHFPPRGHVDERVEEFLAGLLDAETVQAMEQHAQACPRCERALIQARQSASWLGWLRPEDAPPEPGPAFYARVRESIEKKRSSGWLGQLAASLRPNLAYPVVFLGLLAAAWTVTFLDSPEEDLMVMDFPSTGLVNLPPSDGLDLVMMTLIETPEDSERE